MPNADVSPEVALFVPCYVDQLYPAVAWAALELLEAHGARVHVPAAQACCGQPLLNTGAAAAARRLAGLFRDGFGPYARVVCPSGSCAAALRRQLRQRPGEAADAPRVYELCEYLVGVLGVRRVEAAFPRRVALHQSCHAVRELGLGAASELGGGERGRESPARQLLAGVAGLELVEPERSDECCGFGGTFCVAEAPLSARMGEDRLADFERAGAQVVTSMDTSCLLHLAGLARRQGRPLVFLHVAEVLRGWGLGAQREARLEVGR